MTFRHIMRIAITACMMAMAAASVRAQEVKPGVRVAVLGALPGLTDAQEAEEATALLKRAGYPVTILTPAQFADSSLFNIRTANVLVLPHADTFPANAQPNLLAFLQAKGRLLCLGGPPFARYAYAEGAAWKTREKLLESLPYTPLLDLQKMDLAAWTRAAANPESSSNLTRESGVHGTALHFQFSHYAAWDNFGPPAFSVSPFAHGAALTVFWAKGGPRTSALVMEWNEKDGSRWIGSVKLTEQWRRYVLAPSDYRYWNDSRVQGRGGEGDAFHPENASEWRIGLADSHAILPPGRHEFWIAEPGSAILPADATEVTPPLLECLSPAYNLYQTADGTWLPVVRERGVGLIGERPGRLLFPESRGEALEIRGGVEKHPDFWIYLCLSGPRNGASWGDIPAARPLIRSLAPALRRMLQNVYFMKAGTDKPSYRAGETVVVGGQALNLGSRSRIRTQIEVRPVGNTPPVGEGMPAAETLLSDRGMKTEFHVAFKNLPPGEYVTRVTLRALSEQRVPTSALDRIVEPFRVLPAKPAARSRERVTVRRGEFVLNGKPWRPVGLNYWPLWIAGQEVGRYHLHWLSPDQYDPELVERDLDLCERLGVNLVSVQYVSPDEAPALDDFLARCRNHSLKANIFVANADPLAYQPGALKTLLQLASLRDNPTVFAFDIAWEPHVGAHNDRNRLDVDWRNWISEQYGSLANAENDWGMAAPLEDGRVTNPSDEQLVTDGPWRIFVAAYRRFLDDAISRRYRRTAELLRPYGALLGVRSGYGGNGSAYIARFAPFDLLSGACHLDFISPEGYAVGGAWPEFRGGGLTTAYARYAGNGKPVFWAEFGQSVYPGMDAAKISAQGEYYDKFYRLIVDSGANGSSSWWFPGGLRVDENSDFGIINPDGTPRPAALRMQQHAQKELPTARVDPKPDTWITVDRDTDARGYAGIYEKYRSEYGRLRTESRVPGVKTDGTGQTTAGMPLIAVGNIPASGHNPLKYVNAELELSPDGRFVNLYNTGDADWTHGSTIGMAQVVLCIYEGENLRLWEPLERDVPRYGSLKFSLRKLRNNKLWPGKYRFRLAVMNRRLHSGNAGPLPFGEIAEDR